MNEQEIIDKIKSMSRTEVCRVWRFAPSDHPYFDTSGPYWEHFEARFKELGGFTPEISKSLGWENKA